MDHVKKRLKKRERERERESCERCYIKSNSRVPHLMHVAMVDSFSM